MQRKKKNAAKSKKGEKKGTKKSGFTLKESGLGELFSFNGD